MTDIVERLRPDPSGGPCCPFCHRDPYHYVDIGVGYQAAAVECCGLGIGLFQYGDEQLVEIADRMTEAATEIERLRKHAEVMAAHLEWAHEGIERGDLGERMCCDGRMCGCMGALKGDEVLHYGREAIAAYRAEYPEEK